MRHTNSVQGPFPFHRFLRVSPRRQPGPNVLPCGSTCTQAVPPQPACPSFAPAFLLASSAASSQLGWKKTGLGRQKSSISSKLCRIPILGVTPPSSGSGGSLTSPAQPQTPIISQPPLAPQISPCRSLLPPQHPGGS